MSREFGDKLGHHRANQRDGYAMSIGDVARVVGGTAGGVWVAERAIVRRLWRMTLSKQYHNERDYLADFYRKNSKNFSRF